MFGECFSYCILHFVTESRSHSYNGIITIITTSRPAHTHSSPLSRLVRWDCNWNWGPDWPIVNQAKLFNCPKEEMRFRVRKYSIYLYMVYSIVVQCAVLFMLTFATFSLCTHKKNLDNWKSSRRKRVEHIIDRVVETKKLELEEHDRTRRKSKTFTEMMEERQVHT